MAGIRHWSVILASSRARRPRWLDENGHLTADPGRALRLVSPEVAARRVQAFMEIHGWPVEVMERFRLVPAPQAQPRRRLGRTAPRPQDDRPAAA